MEYIGPIIVAIGGLIAAFVSLRRALDDSAAGAAARYERLLGTMQDQLDKLEADRDASEEEIKGQQGRITDLERDNRQSKERIYSLERQQRADEEERAGLKRLLATAIGYIDVVCDMLVEMGGTPPDRPPEIERWLQDNHKEND